MALWKWHGWRKTYECQGEAIETRRMVMIKMIVGNYYLDKNGKKTGPLTLNKDSTKHVWPYRIPPTNNQSHDWYVKEGGYVNRGMGSTDQLSEYVPTGFEVGKKYIHSSGMRVRTVEYVSPSGVALAIDDETGKAVAYNNFSDYKEYIPPPPEEWRIVYKDRFGNVTVGKTPFKSESGAKASPFWTDHSDQNAFKTIRVDA